MFKVNNKNTKTTLLTSFWCFCCYLWTHFMFNVSIVDFEQVNVSWVIVAAAQIQSFKPRFTQQKYLTVIWIFNRPQWTNYIVTDTGNLFTGPLLIPCCVTLPASDFWTTESFLEKNLEMVREMCTRLCQSFMMKKNALVKYCCYIVFELKKILPKWFGLSGIQNNFSFVNQEKLWFRLISSFHANVPLLYPLKNVRKPELWKTILLIWIVICIGF